MGFPAVENNLQVSPKAFALAAYNRHSVLVDPDAGSVRNPLPRWAFR